MKLKLHKPKYLLLTGLLTILCGCTKEETYPSVGDPLPDFSLTLNTGVTLSHLDLTASDCLLVFFHTECPDCQRELPVIEEFHRQHNAIRTVAISREEDDESVSAYWDKNGFTMLYSPQEDRDIYNLFTDRGIPHTVVSRKGIITAIYTDSDQLTVRTLEKQFNL